ncbi:TetR/AcrR family transcriptional regulator [Pyruvatibacter sp.]|uniref:TetR/AcrR family transcriptional regulator n=1 Tax=Pyruvatibacter sp. TaxID=1981328 RepID=UPI0032EF8059
MDSSRSNDVDDRFFSNAASGLGKRERTLAALLDAAVDVIGRKGMEAAKISDMTTAAGLANGTFYNYFQSKEEILHKVALDLAIEVSRRLDDQMTGINDGPTRVVTATSGFVDLVLNSPDWAAILLDAQEYVSTPPEGAFQHLIADLTRGVEQEVFSTQIDAFTLSQIVALIGAAIHFQLKHGRDQTLTHRLCIHILRLLGMSKRNADSVTRNALARDIHI